MTPVERVVWQDSVLLDGWQDIATLSFEASVIYTLGYLVHEDERAIHIAAALHGTEAAGVIVIPKGVIASRERISAGGDE